jgi:hypothetical protein
MMLVPSHVTVLPKVGSPSERFREASWCCTDGIASAGIAPIVTIKEKEKISADGGKA